MPTTVSQGTLDELGRLIDAACEKGDNVSAIAARSRVHRKIVSGIRNRSYISNPTLDNVEAIAAAIGVRIVFERTE